MLPRNPLKGALGAVVNLVVVVVVGGVTGNQPAGLRSSQD